MIDLNTVVSPSSDLNLIEADFTNDGREIMTRGFTPQGDVHTAILIPEGEEEGDEPDLRSMEDTSSVQRAPLTLRMKEFLTERTMHQRESLNQLRKRAFVLPGLRFRPRP
jgi:neutral trehalase